MVNHPRSFLGVGVTLAATTALLAVPVVSASAAPTHKVTPTPYALQAFGYGSRVVGGDVPAGSDRSAFQLIACTNKAGLNRTNAEADVDLGTGLHLSAVKTRVWTTKRGNTVSSFGRNSIARVRLLNTPGGNLTLRGVSSTAHTWHNRSGFHAGTMANIAKIVLRFGGVATEFPVPARGETLRIPGVASITLGKGTPKVGTGGATAFVDAVRLHIALTDTTAYLAHSRATIRGGVTKHLYGGSSYATKADAVQGRVTSGPTPYLVMPCVGTHGRLVKKSLAHANLGFSVAANGLRVSQRTTGAGAVTNAFERAEAARVRLGAGLVIKAVVARAHANRNHGRLSTDTKGTSLGKIFYQGTRLTIPPSGVLRIRGVAKIESRLVKHIKGGIDVTALKVTLLDGRLATVNIGHARVRITGSGL